MHLISTCILQHLQVEAFNDSLPDLKCDCLPGRIQLGEVRHRSRGGGHWAGGPAAGCAVIQHRLAELAVILCELEPGQRRQVIMGGILWNFSGDDVVVGPFLTGGDTAQVVDGLGPLVPALVGVERDTGAPCGPDPVCRAAGGPLGDGRRLPAHPRVGDRLQHALLLQRHPQLLEMCVLQEMGADELGDQSGQEGGQAGEQRASQDLHHRLRHLTIGRLGADSSVYAAAPYPFEHHEVPHQEDAEEHQVVSGRSEAGEVVQRLLEVVHLNAVIEEGRC
mmetsp:Transcript_46837/g.117252  ORF Transcript_46837/g.117252 Transcript_46837/m.117252 type:complete len:278 (-) Transcript_46837:772-1605(-)